MTDRQRDALIHAQLFKENPALEDGTLNEAMPHYTTSVADDYKVLEFIRKEWGLPWQERFDYVYGSWLREGAGYPAVRYQPGDWGLTALICLANRNGFELSRFLRAYAGKWWDAFEGTP